MNPHALLQLAEQVAADHRWISLAGTGPPEAPSVHFAPVAAAEVALNSLDSAVARLIHDCYNDAAAIDTEEAGGAQAGHLWPTPTLAVRGISDTADGDKDATARSTWRHISASNAAAFAIALASQYAADPIAAGPAARH